MKTADERMLAQVVRRLDLILRRLEAIEKRTRLIGRDREAMFKRFAEPPHRRATKRAPSTPASGDGR